MSTFTASAETTSKAAQHNLAQPNYTITKQNCTAYWKDAIKLQQKIELYLDLKGHYKPTEYLSCVKEHKVRKTLTKYRLSDHCLATDRERHRQTSHLREHR